MVEVKTQWTEENLKEYTKYVAINKNQLNKFIFIIISVIYVIVTAGCIAIYCIFQYTFALIMAIGFTCFIALCVLFFILSIRGFVKTTLNSNENEEFDSVLINGEHIFICKDQQPIGELDWSKITKIYINDKAGAVYLCTEDNAVLLLEYKNIVGGTEKELRETVKEKHDQLSKKA